MAQEVNKSSNLSKKQAVLISGVILLITAVIAGFFIWQAISDKAGDAPGFSYKNAEDALVFPGIDAPDEQIRKHTNLVLDNAADVNIIELADCRPEPLIARVPLGSNIIFKNTDDATRMLRWPHEVKDGATEFEIAPLGEDFITIDFLDVETMADVVAIGYFCGPSLEPAGIILIEGSVVLP